MDNFQDNIQNEKRTISLLDNTIILSFPKKLSLYTVCKKLYVDFLREELKDYIIGELSTRLFHTVCNLIVTKLLGKWYLLLDYVGKKIIK